MERVLNFFIVVVKDSLEYVHTSIMREKERKRTPNSSRLRGGELRVLKVLCSVGRGTC